MTVDLKVFTLPELRDLYSRIQAEFVARGVSRTAGGLEGEIGERLALSVYGGALPLPGTKSYDLVDAIGRQIQVKTRTLPRGDGRMFQFHDLDFDLAVCIRFERETGQLDWAREYEVGALRGLVSAHTNGPRLPMVRAKSSGLDVTKLFRDAYATLLGAA